MIYLNNAATSWPKPSSVCEAVQACLMGTPASQFRGGSAILKKDTEERCREKLGKLLGREVDGENDRRHACTSPGVWRRKPAHMRSPASDQK